MSARKKLNEKIRLIGVLLVLLLALGVGCYFVLGKDKVEKVVDKAKKIAETTGSIIKQTDNQDEALVNADAIYTDVWVSMGEPGEVWAERIKELSPYQVNANAFSYAKADAKFMHCLPAFHDLNTTIGQEIYEKFGIDCMEVTDEIFEGERSIVFDEAENRMHSIKAVMYATLG